MTPGHVFIIRGDLTKLHCDAWLVPTDAAFIVEEHWKEGLTSRAQRQIESLATDRAAPPPGSAGSIQRVLPLAPMPSRSAGPKPYLVDVGGHSATPAAWFVAGVREFFDRIHEDDVTAQATKRARALVALPLIGTGQGGGQSISGDIVRTLISALFDAAEQYGFDIALVTWTAAAFAAAQVRRQEVMAARGITVAALLGDSEGGRLTTTMNRLADYAAGSLVLFLGAGVSQAAGLPGWKKLLTKLANAADMAESERQALASLSYPDQAHIVQSRLHDQDKVLRDEIKKLVSSTRYALAHGLLASMPVREVVTTNYDTLFEAASVAAGQPAAVLPYEPAVGKDRWLLKLHGCIERSQKDAHGHPMHDIVLTREDYLRYGGQRGALAGIVQAMLITKHMLFVGFSLKDDNFIRIVDDVRKVVQRNGTDGPKVQHFGTALFLKNEPLLGELWSGDVEVVSVAGDALTTTAGRARQLEIFLDVLLAAVSRAVPPLLDPAYDGMLDVQQRELAEGLRALHGSVQPLPMESAIRRSVDELLRQFGAPRSQDHGTDDTESPPANEWAAW